MDQELIDFFQSQGVDVSTFASLPNINPSPKYIEKLKEAYRILMDGGIDVQRYEELYCNLGKNYAYESIECAKRALKLHSTGIEYQGNEVLYHALFTYANTEQLIAAYNIFKKVDINYHEHQPLYKAIFANSCDADIIANTLAIIKKAELSCQDSESLYQATLYEIIRRAKNVNNNVQSLINAGITLKENIPLYHMVIERTSSLNTSLANACIKLHSNGIDYLTNRLLYVALADNEIKADNLATAFVSMYSAGLDVENNLALYQTIISNLENAMHLSEAFSALQCAGASPQTHPELFALAADNPPSTADSITNVLAIITKAGLSRQDSVSLNQAILAKINGNAVNVNNNVQSLIHAGITLKENIPLYHMVIERTSSIDGSLVNACIKLHSNGIDYITNRLLYLAIADDETKADNLATAFVSMYSAGLDVENNLALYQAIISNPENAVHVSEVFLALQRAGASLKAQPELFALAANYPSVDVEPCLTQLLNLGFSMPKDSSYYEQIIKIALAANGPSSMSDSITNVLAIIKNAWLSSQDSVSLYKAILAKINENAVNVNNNVQSLIHAGITLKENIPLYHMVIERTSSLDSSLANACIKLHSNGIDYITNQLLYLAIANDETKADNLATAFVLMHSAGLDVENNLALYQAIISNPENAVHLSEAFSALQRAGASLKAQPELFALAVKYPSAELEPCLSQLLNLGFSIPKDSSYYEQIIQTSTVSLDILNSLKENGILLPDHRYVYELLFVTSPTLTHSPYRCTIIKYNIEAYLTQNALKNAKEEGYKDQRQELIDIINKVIDLSGQMSEGPLNKSDATKELESVLLIIMKTELDKIKLSFDESLGYILKIAEEPEIHLSELLRLANFNHVELSNEEVESIGMKIEEVSRGFNNEIMLSNNPIVRQLPEAARRALYLYTGNSCYKPLNRLFRGVWLSTMDEGTPPGGPYGSLYYFLLGCLVNWAAAELPRILHRSHEHNIFKKIINGEESTLKKMRVSQELYQQVLDEALNNNRITTEEFTKVISLFDEQRFFLPNYGLIDRFENLDESAKNGELGIHERRLNNPVITSSVSSFSVFQKGINTNAKGVIRTKVETDNSSRVVINDFEGEILIPQGTSFKYTYGTNRYFVREVNSPSILPSCGLWSSKALVHAYRNHLQHPYRNGTHSIDVNNKTIYRPNHGLAHSYRKMLYLDIIINYFAHHALDENFRTYCQHFHDRFVRNL